MIDALGSSTNKNPEKARTSLGNTFDNFLKMLVTQMKNQDPLSPMESAEFTNQLVMFSQVEQQISGNEKLDKIAAAIGNNGMQTALGYIGLDAEVQADQFPYSGEGGGKFRYALDREANQVRITITDDKGNVVRSFDGEKGKGLHFLQWDGKDDEGDAVPAGEYKFNISAKAMDGSKIETSHAVPGRITGIETAEGITYLLFGSQRIDVSRVLSARQPI